MYVLDRFCGGFRPACTANFTSPEVHWHGNTSATRRLTAQKFVSAPWDTEERLYASGDTVRLGPDGTIEFRSRADRQVKIRGLRVEPAEIDRVLLEPPRDR